LFDAVVFQQNSGTFESCLDMIRSVVEWFTNNPQYFCILKAHPGEKYIVGIDVDVSYAICHSVLKRYDIRLPENVCFVDYDANVTVAGLFELVKGIIAYSSSVCMDAGLCGLPSISVLASHYSQADFSQTPNSKKDFFRMLEYMLQNENNNKDAILDNARKYYFLYYCIGSIDYKLIKGNDVGSVPAEILFDSVDQLLAGRNEALDYICDSILNCKPIFGDNRWPSFS
jgi:hypothetical protein